MTQPSDPSMPAPMIHTAAGAFSPIPLLKRAAAPGAPGLGAPPGGAAGGGAGLGWYGSSSRPKLPSVYEFLEMGSPRLALARALGVPFAPWGINLSVVFNSVGPSVEPNVASDTKIIQDTYVESVCARVLSQNTPENQFDTLNGFFGNFQNAFEIQLRVTGAPRYDIYPRYVMLSNAIDMLAGAQFEGWVLTYDQQLQMDIQSTFGLPEDSLPIKVQVTFRTRAPIGESFTRMTADEALKDLQNEFGIECRDAYRNWHCR